MHYEQSTAWEMAMRLAESACRQATRLPGEERYGMRLQMTRAAISVPCNIAEGWNRESRKEKAQFMAIAQGSLAELNTQLILCGRLQWLDDEPLRELQDSIARVGRMLTKLRQRYRQQTASAER